MGENEYDVVIVGGGPAGCSAAKTSAEKGLKTIVIEEHPQIGIPRHCTGIIKATSYNEEILQSMEEGVRITKTKLIRVYSPKGKVMHEIPSGAGGYMCRREEYDRGWAKLAGNAGADIHLSSRVTGLLKQDGAVCGVITSSKKIPKVFGKVVIAADGIRAFAQGIPKWEGLSNPSKEDYRSGIQLELTGVRDIEPGIVEVYWGRSATGKGWNLLCPVSDIAAWTDVPNMAAFEEIKAGDSVFSKKIKDAVVIQKLSFGPWPWYMGIQFPKTVKDGLILAGNAAGLSGAIVAALSGRFAAEVAYEAIQAGDVTERRLSPYHEKCREVGLSDESARRVFEEALHKVHTLSEDEAERALLEMAESGKEVWMPINKPF